ncbi:MAG TPA: prolipoprotein diacylglyceryl transferase [Chthoniobacterales bacterium]|jgi:phosphatidylglycerol:prolipoprotein diacylglycerol transferase
MLAYYVHHLSPFVFQFPNGMGPRWYGLAYVMAFVIGTLLYRRLAQRGYSELKPAEVSDFITWAALFGVMLGGRIGYFLFYDFASLLEDPMVFFRVWQGGMASHGGILGLFFYTLWYARKHRVSWTGLGDNLVVVAAIGIFFGRIANFINGELYGRITQVSWAMQFPAELQERAIWNEKQPQLEAALAKYPTELPTAQAIIDEARRSETLRDLLRDVLNPRHPSQLYAAVLEGLLLFAILWFVRTKMQVKRGVLTGLFFILYALGRISGEQFREPDASLFGPFTRGQFYSFFMILIGVAFILWSRRAGNSESKN